MLSYNIGRDLDDLVNSLSSVMNIEEKISRLKDMKNSDMYAGQTDEIESLIEAANKELVMPRIIWKHSLQGESHR